MSSFWLRRGKLPAAITYSRTHVVELPALNSRMFIDKRT